MQVCVCGKEMEGTLVFSQQRNDGTNVQTVQLSRAKILSYKGRMPKKLEKPTRQI